MKNKYLVVDRNGNIHDPKKYLESGECSHLMQQCIQREVFGQNIAENIKPAEKPEYIENANKLGFSWEENSAPGFMQYDYKANFILRLVQEYARHLVHELDFPVYEVRGANFFDLKHPVVKAYANLFGDRLFNFSSKEEELVMSYDASYPQFNLASKYQLSEKHLPFAHFSISDCYRYEQSGECMLLFRGRRFHMPDLHPYFKNLEEAWAGYFEIEKQLNKSFALAKRKYINVAKVSSEKNWEDYKYKICEIAARGQKEMLIEIKMDNQDRYWIVDIDYSFIDKLGQIREVGCIQIDVGNAKRLGIQYKDSKGNFQNPVIIHAAVPGGIERYIYMLLDNIELFPKYFAPVQLRLIPVSQKHISFAKEIAQKFPNIRIEIDDRAESVGKKIKSSMRDLVPKYLVIGEQEENSGLPEDIYSYIKDIEDESKDLPHIVSFLPKLLDAAAK